MRFKFLVLFLTFCSIISTAFSQESIHQRLVFYPVFNNSAIRLDNTFFKLRDGDIIQFETLKFYISAIEFLMDDKPVWKEENSFHLIDAADEKTLCVGLEAPSTISFNKIKFNLGIDSITNYAGALGGDLDPTKGMYWTWQNGYINFKLEGRSNLCETRKNEFQFHLGGFQYPFNTLQKIILKITQQVNIDIAIDLEKLIYSIDLSKENQIMSPCREAVMISKIISETFRVVEK